MTMTPLIVIIQLGLCLTLLVSMLIKVSSTPYKNDFGDFVYKDCGDDNLREDQSPPHNIGHHSPKKMLIIVTLTVI